MILLERYRISCLGGCREQLGIWIGTESRRRVSLDPRTLGDHCTPLSAVWADPDPNGRPDSTREVEED